MCGRKLQLLKYQRAEVARRKGMKTNMQTKTLVPASSFLATPSLRSDHFPRAGAVKATGLEEFKTGLILGCHSF
jgi:hypothetical protein